MESWLSTHYGELVQNFEKTWEAASEVHALAITMIKYDHMELMESMISLLRSFRRQRTILIRNITGSQYSWREGYF